MPCSVAAAVLILTNQNVRRLAVDNGRVTGVIIGSGEFIGARNGVVLATGGYGANPEMSWRFEQLPGSAHEASGLMPASLTGDGLVLGAEIGGILHKVCAGKASFSSSGRTWRNHIVMPMKPVYAARIEDLGLSDFVKVECNACGHAELLWTDML
jgi:FAD binding domain-containing protein